MNETLTAAVEWKLEFGEMCAFAFGLTALFERNASSEEISKFFGIIHHVTLSKQAPLIMYLSFLEN